MTSTKSTGPKGPLPLMQKPDFLITGYMVNDGLLAPYRDELLKSLPSSLKNHAAIDEFLRAVSEVVHNSEMSALPQNPGSQDMVASPSKSRDTALAVAKHAQRLQEALGELRRDSRQLGLCPGSC